MKNKRSNRQLYQDTFDQIKLSDQGYRQIRNMEENTMIRFNKEQKRRLGFRVAVSFAALAVVFLSANGIAYAATGNTLIEQVTEHVTVYINEKSYDGANVKKFKTKNGDINYEVSLNEKTDQSAEITMGGSPENTDIPSEKDKQSSSKKEATGGSSEGTAKEPTEDTATQEDFKTSLQQLDGKIYLFIEGKSSGCQVDISKDYADGNAKGTVQIAGEDYQYSVSGNTEKYQIDLKKR